MVVTLLMELAEPLVQEHLRPLVEMIIRDFPAAAEARHR